MSCAYSPKHLAESLLHYIHTHGKDKIPCASDHPALSMYRCLKEEQVLDPRTGVLEIFLYSNAQ